LIVVDSSALVRVALQETGFVAFERLMAVKTCIVSAAQLLETHMVLTGKGYGAPVHFIDGWLATDNVRVVALDLPHFHAARDAFNRYGKGQGHPAQLNFGDCLSYAVAKIAGVPLLFAGEDFRLTDIEPALNP
jgi:ribonuclease VapC